MKILVVVLSLIMISPVLAQQSSSADPVQLQLSGLMHDIETGIWQLSNKVRQLELENAKLKKEIEDAKQKPGVDENNGK
jgi:hypothetical protein